MFGIFTTATPKTTGECCNPVIWCTVETENMTAALTLIKCFKFLNAQFIITQNSRFKLGFYKGKAAENTRHLLRAKIADASAAAETGKLWFSVVPLSKTQLILIRSWHACTPSKSYRTFATRRTYMHKRQKPLPLFWLRYVSPTSQRQSCPFRSSARSDSIQSERASKWWSMQISGSARDLYPSESEHWK